MGTKDGGSGVGVEAMVMLDSGEATFTLESVLGRLGCCGRGWKVCWRVWKDMRGKLGKGK